VGSGNALVGFAPASVRFECDSRYMGDVGGGGGLAGTCVQHAARAGNVEVIRRFWAPQSADVAMLEWRDRWSRTAVHWAVLNGHVQCLKALLQSGASPSPPNARHGAHLKSTYLTIETPLQLAQRRYRSGVGGGAVGEEVLRLLSAAVSADAQVAMRETRLSVALLAAAHTDRAYHADGLDEESLSFLRCGETPPPPTCAQARLREQQI
jgi:hypothetical protein